MYVEVQSVKQMEMEEQNIANDLIERILYRDNLSRAYQIVESNNGTTGTDGNTDKTCSRGREKTERNFLHSISGVWF